MLCLAEAVQIQEVPLDPLWILEPELLWVGGPTPTDTATNTPLTGGSGNLHKARGDESGGFSGHWLSFLLTASSTRSWPSTHRKQRASTPGSDGGEGQLILHWGGGGQGEQGLTLACALGPANGSLPFGSAALLAHRERKGMQATLMSPERLRSKGEGGRPSGPSSLQAPQRSRGEEPGRKGRVFQPSPEDGLRWLQFPWWWAPSPFP